MSIYNRFAPEKRWVALQAQSGRRLQSAELNEIQSLSLYRDKRMGDVIFGSGHIIEGGQIYVQDDKKKVIIFPATVYFDGVIHDIDEKRITITGQGEEIIGLKITYTTLTYEMVEGKELLDPAVGYANFGSPGMDRLVATPEWVLNDAAAIPMYRLINGEVITAKVPPELEGFTPVLARRTYDASGSFLVSGMDGFIEPAEGDFVTLVIEAGKAYVLGYEINRLVPTRIKVKKSLDTRRVSDEVHTFINIDTPYSLSSKPVKAIQEITARVMKDVKITRGGSSDRDSLSADAVVDIVKIVQGAKTYVKGTDYKLIENSVDWIGTNRPSPGDMYLVTFEYMKPMVQGTDYKLKEGTNEVVWLGGMLPVEGSIFNVTYDYYLSRKDVFYLTADGQIQIVTGQSDIHPPSPPVPPDVLELGELQFPPASSNVVVVNNKPKRLTMLELRSLLDRLERAEYNQAMLELDRTAQISDPATFKKGFFTDNFTNFERADLVGGFDAMIDPSNQTLQLPVNQLFLEMEVESLNSVRMHERLLTLDYTEQLIIDQSYGTEALNVNPYQVFGSQATIRLTPSQDSWVETSYIYQTVWGWWDAWWTGNRSETRVIVDENIPFIRQRVVMVYGEGFEPNSNNLQATFDGVDVALVPFTGYEAGTKPDTIKANGAGKFIATFTIPPNIRTGTREVRIFNYV